jgi:hypothetical protein
MAPSSGIDHVVMLCAGAENSKVEFCPSEVSGSVAQIALAVDCSPVAIPETDRPVNDTSSVRSAVALLMATITAWPRNCSTNAEIWTSGSLLLAPSRTAPRRIHRA